MTQDFKGFKGLEHIGSDTVEALVKIILNGEPILLSGTLDVGQVLMRISDGEGGFLWTNRTAVFPDGPDISNKVDKIPGKGLSTEDFTTTLKNLLDQQSGTNTGDETETTIKTKLGITTISGDNTGDQDAREINILDAAEIFIATTVEAALMEVKLIADQNKLDIVKTSKDETITLPAFASVAARCSNAVVVTDYPTGWILSAGASEYDLSITHNLNKNIKHVDIFEINADTTERQLPSHSAANTGLLQMSKNQILIEGLTQDELPLRIELTFK